MNFKTANEVAIKLLEYAGIEIKISDPKIYKKQGKKYIVCDEKLGALFCLKTNQLERIFFINNVVSGGANTGIIYIK